MQAWPSPVCCKAGVLVFADVSSGLELRQDDAIARAFQVDDLLRAGLMIQRLCGACGRPISEARLALVPRATRCSMCIDNFTLARKHNLNLAWKR